MLGNKVGFKIVNEDKLNNMSLMTIFSIVLDGKSNKDIRHIKSFECANKIFKKMLFIETKFIEDAVEIEYKQLLILFIKRGSVLSIYAYNKNTNKMKDYHIPTSSLS